MANEQLKLELKEHYSKSCTKLESALQAQALKADEDRQRLASVQAEVVKGSKSLLIKRQPSYYEITQK